MKKIISLFQRNYDTDHLVRNEVVPGAEWVLAGEGVATRKYDGMCCMIREGKLYKRYEVKPNGKAPANFEPAGEVDEVTGKQQGWLPVGDGPEDKYFRQARDRAMAVEKQLGGGALMCSWEDGTYELVGDKVQGNVEGALGHWLVRHGKHILNEVPRDYEGIKAYLSVGNIEGIVWHHPDGRMVKIKTKDFGFKRS